MSLSPKYKQLAVLALMLASLSGCASMKDWFTSDKAKAKKALEPAELVKFEQTLKIDKLWSTKVGKGEGRIGVGQAPVVVDGVIYAAAVEGGVVALDLQSGKQRWQYRPEKEKGKDALRLTGGPGAGEGLVAIGTLDGQVIALDAASGAERWRARVPAEVITAPAVANGMVFVRGNDGRVTAFDAGNGTQRWFNAQELPALTVRGNAPVLAGPGVLFIGNDDGSLQALAMADGRPLWEQQVGQPEGRTDLDRMADVDAAPVLDGNVLFVSSYKNQTMAIEGPSGRPLWLRDHGNAGSLAVTSGAVLVADGKGVVWSLDKYSGSASWSQPALARRELTGVAVQGDYAVVGDLEGYLHWLRLSDGAFAARIKHSGDRLLAAPRVVDGILLVQNVDGKLAAYGLRQ